MSDAVAKEVIDASPKVRDFSASELISHFEYWSKEHRSKIVADVSEASQKALRESPTTHTFGWMSGNIKELYRRILFEDEALLCENSRRSHGGSLGASMVHTAAASLGLTEFVFTYLGVHAPYYARTHFPAFGVFVKTSAEQTPQCIPSRRDLASSHIDASKPLKVQFLLPAHARELAIIELGGSEHNGNLNHYWGDPNLWEGEYSANHWEGLFEFHFLESIPVTQFHAILWPRQTMVNPFTGGFLPTTYTRDLSEFVEAHPECSVIGYDPRIHLDPEKAFVEASSKAISYYLRQGRFPSQIAPDTV